MINLIDEPLETGRRTLTRLEERNASLRGRDVMVKCLDRSSVTPLGRNTGVIGLGQNSSLWSMFGRDRWSSYGESVGRWLIAPFRRRVPWLRTTEVFSGRALGTSYRVLVAGPSGVEREVIAGAIENSLQRIDALMSIYRADSDIGRLNLAQHSSWMPIASETALVIQQGIEIGHRSGGIYDITIGALVNAWGFGPSQTVSTVPSAEQIDAARLCGGLENLELQGNRPAVRKRTPKLRVDLSSIAKGFAVDCVTNNLELLGIFDLCVEVGGEIRAQGRNARGTPWQIAVEAPVSGPHAVQRIVPLSGKAMATSGDYRQYFAASGKRFSHIIDPRTGYPIQHALTSVTVWDKTCMRADGWATALLVAGPEDGLRLAEKEDLAALFIVRTADGFEERGSSKFECIRRG